MSKLPSFQFYPGDWLKDPDLRRCSKAARGVWIDMICLSFECEDRGVFATSGIAWPDEDIAAAVGGNITEVLDAIAELLTKGVVSRNQTGAIFCRRVVRDEAKRRSCSEAGKRGGGNPALTFKGVPKGDDKERVKGEVKRKPKASSSLSSSSSTSVNTSTTTKEPLSTTADPPGEDSQATWGVVAEGLREYGLARVSDTIAEAKEAGYFAKQIVDWLDWLNNPLHPYRKEKLGPGVIIDRIRIDEARFWAVDFGWPPMLPKELAGLPNKIGETSYPIRGVTISERDLAELQKLEESVGAKFDRMSDLEVQTLIGKQRGPVNVKFRRSDPASRLDLLRKIMKD